MKTLECRGITLSDKQTKICVPITGTDLEEIKEQAEKIANMNPDVVEWRADFYDVKDNDETEFEQCLKAINDNLKKIPIIYTYRTSNEGGEKSIDVDDYCRLCKYVSEISEKYNVAMIDVELYENKDRKDIGKLLLDIKSTGVKVIGSNHHFEGTPSEKDIFNVLKTMEEAGADICKIAVMPKEKVDVKTLINASKKANKELNAPIITMSMGELGAVTRICTRMTGSVVTFGAGVNTSAPGQPPCEMVRFLLKASESGKIDCNVALIGFMGTGKTTISNALSRITGFKEVDVDQYIVEKEGMAIKDIFAENGEKYFRDLETQALRDLQEEKETTISCGGGAVLRDENVEILNTGSVIVQLKATPETVFERVKDHTHRPILNNDMSVRHITELMNQREPRYNSVADIQVNVDKGDRVETCYYILKELEKTGHFSVE